MKNVVICLIVLCCSFQLFAQNQKRKQKVYKTWVKLKNDDVIMGYLAQLKDSSIVLSEEGIKELRELSILNIEELKFRRKGRIGKSVAIGAGAGLIVGGITGYSSGDDGWFSKEDTAIGLGLFLMPIGAGIGAIVGITKKKYDIHGEVFNYKRYRPELNQYVLVNRITK